MEPTIIQGDRLIGKYIENLKWVRSGEVYIVICEAGVVVKRVKNFLEEQVPYLKCISDNKEYDPYSLPAPEIKEVWKVVGIIRTSINHPKEDPMVKILELEQEIIKLRKI